MGTKHKSNRLVVSRRTAIEVALNPKTRSCGPLPTLAYLAPHLFVLEVRGKGSPIYRVAGSAIQRSMGLNPQGEEFYNYWDTEAQAKLEFCFNTSSEIRQPFRLSSASLSSRRDAVEYITFLIPADMIVPESVHFIGLRIALNKHRKTTAACIQRLQQVTFLESAHTRKSPLPRHRETWKMGGAA
jgi:hypothetical protein